MQLMLALLLLTTLSYAYVSEQDIQLNFGKWMKAHDKQYEQYELPLRYNIWKNNLQFVEEHNKRWEAGLETYWVSMNKFADLTNEEFATKYLQANSARHISNPHHPGDSQVLTKLAANDSLDWQQAGAVTPVGDQGSCSAGYAYASAGGVESDVKIRHGALIALSEQQLVDCSGSYGNQGCNGGSDFSAFNYIAVHGLCTNADYPYEARQGTCRASYCAVSPYTKISGYVSGFNEDFIATYLPLQPISVAVEADQQPFRLYSGGVFTGPCGTKTNHFILVVGYGNDSNTTAPYWRAKNSWGTSWGEQGYIRMLRNVDLCGIGLQPAYPRVS
jgi:cathepsin L